MNNQYEEKYDEEMFAMYQDYIPVPSSSSEELNKQIDDAVKENRKKITDAGKDSAANKETINAARRLNEKLGKDAKKIDNKNFSEEFKRQYKSNRLYHLKWLGYNIRILSRQPARVLRNVYMSLAKWDHADYSKELDKTQKRLDVLRKRYLENSEARKAKINLTNAKKGKPLFEGNLFNAREAKKIAELTRRINEIKESKTSLEEYMNKISKKQVKSDEKTRHDKMMLNSLNKYIVFNAKDVNKEPIDEAKFIECVKTRKAFFNKYEFRKDDGGWFNKKTNEKPGKEEFSQYKDANNYYKKYKDEFYTLKESKKTEDEPKESKVAKTPVITEETKKEDIQPEIKQIDDTPKDVDVVVNDMFPSGIVLQVDGDKQIAFSQEDIVDAIKENNINIDEPGFSDKVSKALSDEVTPSLAQDEILYNESGCHSAVVTDDKDIREYDSKVDYKKSLKNKPYEVQMVYNIYPGFPKKDPAFFDHIDADKVMPITFIANRAGIKEEKLAEVYKQFNRFPTDIVMEYANCLSEEPVDVIELGRIMHKAEEFAKSEDAKLQPGVDSDLSDELKDKITEYHEENTRSFDCEVRVAFKYQRDEDIYRSAVFSYNGEYLGYEINDGDVEMTFEGPNMDWEIEQHPFRDVEIDKDENALHFVLSTDIYNEINDGETLPKDVLSKTEYILEERDEEKFFKLKNDNLLPQIEGIDWDNVEERIMISKEEQNMEKENSGSSDAKSMTLDEKIAWAKEACKGNKNTKPDNTELDSDMAR